MTSRKYLFYCAASVALGGLLFGFDSGVISGCEQAIQAEFHLSPFWHGLVVAGALLGTVLGVFCASWPSDRWGRRPTLVLMATLFLVSAVGCAFTVRDPAVGPHMLGWMRFIGGLAIGGVSVVVPLYLVEIAPPDVRGRLVAMNQLNIESGLFVSYVSNFFVARWMMSGGFFRDLCTRLADVFASGPMSVESVEWRVMLGMECIPVVLFAVLLATIPESPRYLVRAGRLEEARSVLERIGFPEVEKTLGEIRESLAALLHSNTQTLKHSNNADAALFQRKFRKPILLAFLVAFFSQVSGVNAINYYGPRIFDMVFGAGSQTASLMGTMGVGLMHVVFCVAAFFIIDRFGRRVLIIGGSAVMAAMLLLTGYELSLGPKACSPTLAVIGILGFTAAFAISSGAVIWVYISEVFPNSVRAKGQALGSFTHWFMCMVVSWSFVAVAEKAGHWAFYFFAACMLAQLAWGVFGMPETKGGTIEDIERRLGLR